MINRNDPCWCGSGKKYKVCHREMDDRLLILYNEGYEIPEHELIKTSDDVLGLKESAKITVGILDEIEKRIMPGMTTLEINQWIHEYTLSKGGIPATLGYNGFEKSCCTSINDVICHGIPDETALKIGDIINIDVTTILNGYFSDASRMYMVGEVSESAKNIVKVAKECLMVGIEAVKPYDSIAVIGEAIEAYANSKGYSVVRDLGGHGIGKHFHEAPHVHHFKTNDKDMIMVPGMVFTIEPMINEKSYKTKTLKDGWTVMTIDGGLSAQWEHTILVTETGAEIITK